jgi:DNA repair protein RecN (Recombination protein N)
MLTALRIENLAIVERLEVGFEPGLTIITGETGAGKSILVHALKLVLGGRASPDFVRTGTERAEVEALFEIRDDPQAQARLAALDLPAEDEIVIRRTIAASGRGRSTVNGALTTAAQLQQLALGLIDISSQHEHHTLTDPATHLGTLDAYLARPELVARVGAAVEQAEAAAESVRALQRLSRDRAEREDLLRFQLAEIVKLDPRGNELEELQQRVARLRHSDRLRGATIGAEAALYGRERSMCAEIARIEIELQGAAALDPALSPVTERLASARVELEDVASELGRYGRRVDSDPDALSQATERLHALDRLTRRHQGDFAAVLAFRSAAEAELAALSDVESQLQARLAEAERCVRAAYDQAQELSAVRRAGAAALGRAISAELADLGMGSADILVEVAPLTAGPQGLSCDGVRLTSTGIDRAELLIAPNPGEPPRPLRRIASGGELSRALLGTKRVLAGIGPVGTYAFDEVDTGVGGAVADAIGRKLREVARHHQVLCITHQPQIAAYGDVHLQVRKDVSGGRTATSLRRLQRPERVEELARMLGGREVTEEARGAARALLDPLERPAEEPPRQAVGS